MSWSEITGIHDELNNIKKVIKDQFGITVTSGKIRDTDKELDDIHNEIKAYLKKYETLTKRIEDMSLDLTRLTEEVARAHTVQTSAVALLRNLTGELAKVSAELQAKADMVPPVIDVAPLNELIDQLKTSTDSLAGAVADSVGVVPHREVVLNADDATKPTVTVVLPEVLPESVVVSAETVVDTIDPASTEPQVVVTVEPAPVAEAPVVDVVTDVIKTDEGQVDVVVEAPVTVVEEIKAETGVDVVEAVKEAFEVTPEVVAEPVVEAPVAVEPAPEVVAEPAPAAEAPVAEAAPVEAAPAEVTPDAPVAETAPEAPKTE